LSIFVNGEYVNQNIKRINKIANPVQKSGALDGIKEIRFFSKIGFLAVASKSTEKNTAKSLQI